MVPISIGTTSWSLINNKALRKNRRTWSRDGPDFYRDDLLVSYK